MSDINFKFIGWCNAVDADGTKHDKVWCAFNLGGTYYAAWGARGKSLQFKEYGTGWHGQDEQDKVIRKKKAKYVPVDIDVFILFSMFPNFKEELEKKFVFATLAGKIK